MNEFVFAVMKNKDDEFVVVTSMPDGFAERHHPYSMGEVEYILNRVAFDMQGKRMIDEVAKVISPTQQTVSDKVRKALHNRQNKET